jgi:hypothetical protein
VRRAARQNVGQAEQSQLEQECQAAERPLIVIPAKEVSNASH